MLTVRKGQSLPSTAPVCVLTINVHLLKVCQTSAKLAFLLDVSLFPCPPPPSYVVGSVRILEISVCGVHVRCSHTCSVA